MSAKTDDPIGSPNFAARNSFEQADERLVLASRYDDDRLVP